MSSVQEGVVQALKDKLQCNICLSDAGEDVVEALCPGKHTFCFSCIVQHVVHSAGEDSHRRVIKLKCPSCRSGSCSVVHSRFLAEMSSLLDNAEKSENTGWIKHFRQSRDRLKSIYPSVFKQEAGREVITPNQMVVYGKFRKNPLGIILHRHRFAERSSGCLYISVSMNEHTGDFVVSGHRTRAAAMNMISMSPPQFTTCFICGDVSLASVNELARAQEENSPRLVVFFQSRPVQLFLSTPQDFHLYFAGLINDRSYRERIYNQIEYVSQCGGDRESTLTDPGESTSSSWLPI